jgi:hypothetical protein
MKINWPTLWEAAKEPLRLLILGIVSWALVEFTPIANNNSTIAILILILRFVDKYLHEFGKATDNGTLSLGLTRF